MAEFRYPRLYEAIRKVLKEEQVFLESLSVVLMKIMAGEVISDAEQQIARNNVPFYEALAFSFADELQDATMLGPSNITEVYSVIIEVELK